MNPESRSRIHAQARRLRFLGGALAVALLALAIGTGLFARQVSGTAERVNRQLDLSQRGTILHSTYEALGDAETGQRGYLLTGKPRYLEVYADAAASLPELLRSVDALGRSEPAFAASATRIHELADLKLAELARSVALYSSGRRDEAMAIVQTDAGQGYMEELRRVLGEAVVEARRERQAAGARIIADGARTERFAVVAVGALLLSAVLAGLQMRQLRQSRRRYENELLRSERQHRAILEGQQEFVSLSDEDGQLVYTNPAYSTLLGSTSRALVGTNLFELVAPEHRDSVRQRHDAVFSSGQPHVGESLVRAGDGRARWVSWSNQVMEAADGRRYLHSVGRDITQEKELARRLAERERFLRQVADAVPVRIIYFDREQRVQFANLATEMHYGRPVAQIQGRTRAELVPDIANNVLTPHLDAAMHGKRTRAEITERAGEGVRYIEVEAIPDFGEDGVVQGIVAVGVDITRRKADEQALRDLAEIFEASPDAIVQSDRTGKLTYLNPAARRAMGFEAGADLAGASQRHFHTQETDELFAREALAAAGKHGSWVGETTVALAGGRIVPVNHLLIAHKDAGGEVQRYSAIMRDITDVIEARRALKLQSATLASVIDVIPAMVCVYDASSRFRLVNRAFESFTGLSRQRCIGHRVDEVFGDEELERSRPWTARALAGETVSYEREIAATSQRGGHLSVSYVPLRLDDGTIDGFIAMAQDVTEQRAETRRLMNLAERDPLTTLRNRAGFEAELERCLQSGRGDEVAIVYIDLDRFKPVNDLHGHAAGDEVLRQFAQRLERLVRPTDIAARLGGDEFALLLVGVRRLKDAQAVADKVVAMARRPMDIGDAFVTIGASVGVAHGLPADGGWKALLEEADQRMYLAKSAARGGAHGPADRE
jgi:diguanylate cyclase (GGDEF)-like protein/PAS domain S-box-containing protein